VEGNNGGGGGGDRTRLQEKARMEQPSNGRRRRNLVPVGGLAYYISPPATLSVLLHDPFHALFYLAFTLTECAVSGRTWIEVSGTSVQDVMWHDSSVRIR
jgi:hypothetical protein